MAGPSLLTIKRIEAGTGNVSPAMIARAQEALESAGIEFIAENGGGAGVRFRKPKPGSIAIEDLNGEQ
jgi:hypothetical protein